MSGVVSITLLMPYEDAGEIHRRARRRVQKHPDEYPTRTEAVLAELGLGREVTVRAADEKLPVSRRAWAAEADVVRGDPRDYAMGRQGLLYQAHLMGFFDEDDPDEDEIDWEGSSEEEEEGEEDE